MVDVLVVSGAVVGLLLVALLIVTASDGAVRIWPVKMGLNMPSVVFWTLFRGLNVLTFAIAIATFEDLSEGWAPLRVAAAVVAVSCFVFFLYAGGRLGRENLYGGQSGLETRGIYRFTRNPQYAAAMPGFLAGAVAAWSAPAVVVAGLMASAYMLMAIAEEPWLERTYGSAYDRYRNRVPRFYNFRGLWVALQGELSRSRA